MGHCWHGVSPLCLLVIINIVIIIIIISGIIIIASSAASQTRDGKHVSKLCPNFSEDSSRHRV